MLDAATVSDAKTSTTNSVFAVGVNAVMAYDVTFDVLAKEATGELIVSAIALLA
jgi:hypothetical protein